MYKVGILTYHSAYNFGSALQAFATQQAVNRIREKSEIINYRLAEQNYFYKKLYRRKYGAKVFVKDLMMLPETKGRIERANRFEKFFYSYFDQTQEVSEPEEVARLWEKYDVMISGSDQILSKRSHELRNNEWRYMDPYLLTGFSGRKVSYASSVGGALDEDIQHILPALRQFDMLSFREMATAKKISELLQRPVETVLDPTFLLKKEDWLKKLDIKKESCDRFILVYSLKNAENLLKMIKPITTFAKDLNCRIRLITPFAYIPIINSPVERHIEYGPVEFLSALYNSEAVITDSYHGTILSVNFGKDIYSLCGRLGHEFRKVDIMERLGLSDRIVYDLSTLVRLHTEKINYRAVSEKIDAMRDHSLAYLKRCLTN